MPDWGEFVLAELTQPFNQPDDIFQPLMTATEQRLGFRPPYAAFDAAFDAFYIYEYFDQPLTRSPRPSDWLRRRALLGPRRPQAPLRQRRPAALPGRLAMPLRYTFRNKTTAHRAQSGAAMSVRCSRRNR